MVDSASMVEEAGFPRKRDWPKVPTTPSGQFKPSGRTIGDRLWEKVDRSGGENACWLWLGARSRGGDHKFGGAHTERSVYGCINEGAADGGSAKRTWRVHILALVMQPDTWEDVPPEDDESYIGWLRRAYRWYREQGLEVSHQCDVSLCCNPKHLAWETPEQHREGAERRKREREALAQGLASPSEQPVAEELARQGRGKLTREDLGLG